MSRRAPGLRAWMWQRATSIYMALFVIVAGAWLLVDAPGSHAEWRASMSWLPVNLATAIFFWALLIHAWVGARDVLLDYVAPQALRLALLAVLALWLAASGLWVLRVLYALLLPGVT